MTDRVHRAPSNDTQRHPSPRIFADRRGYEDCFVLIVILFSGAAVETIFTPELSRAEAGRALAGEPCGWEPIQPGEMMVTGEVVYFVSTAEKEVMAFRVKCDQRFVGLSEAGNLFRARRNRG